MNRLQRRTTLLRAKRNGCFDTNQYYLEHAKRARVARQVRVLMRRGVPVVLVTPRWSQARRFLDDIAIDVSIEPLDLAARVFSLVWLQGKSAYDTWTWLIRAICELCELAFDGPVAQAVDRHGFRHVMSELLRRSVDCPRTALLMHGAQYLNLDVRNDLIQVFEQHAKVYGELRSFNLLMASSFEGSSLRIEGSKRLVLPDYGPEEAAEALFEYLDTTEPSELQRAIELAGGVPGVLDAIGTHAGQHGELATSRDAMWRILGPLAGEIREAAHIITSDNNLASRFEAVARSNGVPRHHKHDSALIRAGLIQRLRPGKRVGPRAELFTDLISDGPS